ncbi:transcriptional regulator, SARP family [Actinokineospora spheciospongiae]|uniref:Transcriptional regulator, SARP family n=2 Tax=Actinokineospora spheciospongiae TaxID=909613 RepID=W7IG28_9PSEU|nr:transcriptional regulator, SARP family [Actinokineospora spheciospongiae]
MAVIFAIGGTGGIGKTWLALAWAHHILHRCPDGQLFVDLRGFSPAGSPAHPAEVLGGFLDALGVERDRHPADLDQRAALYRSLVSDRRMVVVLDNAASTEQVAPLLPGGRHCVVLITSRNHLPGLVSRRGARPLHLGVLTTAEARTLLATALGPGRATTEARPIALLIELCGGFPLALGLIAARAAAEPHLPLADAVGELHALGLDALDSEDPTASLPAVLSWSLRHLSDRQRLVFALLGIAPGPDTGLVAAAHLTGMSERATHAELRVLVESSLVNRTPGGRYGMHDLVRAYATTEDLDEDVRKPALRRVLDFYTRTARAADLLLDPHRDPPQLDLSTVGNRPHPLPDIAAAWAWLHNEYACLIAAQYTATIHRWHSTVWALAWSLDTFHHRQGHHHNLLALWRAAAEAAVHLPDPTTLIRTHRLLGLAHSALGRHADAIGHLHHGLVLAEGHPTHQAHIHRTLELVWKGRGDNTMALKHARRALDLYRGIDKPVWEGIALNAVGWHTARLGDYDTAYDHCRTALTLHRRHDNPDGEANTLDSLGYIDHHRGHHQQAIHHYHEALNMYRNRGGAYAVAGVLERLGHPHAALDEVEEARAAWREASELFRELGHVADAERVERHIEDLPGTG